MLLYAYCRVVTVVCFSVHNLLLEQPYTKVYGPSELEMPSVLCLVRTIR